MRFCFNISLLVLLLSLSLRLSAQEIVNAQPLTTDSTRHSKYHLRWHEPMDVIDIVEYVLKVGPERKMDTTNEKSHKVHISVLPAAGYTLQTGFALLLAANAAFYTSKEMDENVSNIYATFTYSQYKQIIVPVLSNIWTKNNKYNIQTDWRYVKFPSFTYGLGGRTRQSDEYTIDYSGFRFHQTLFRSIGHRLYLGLGYNLDYFWNIREVDPPANQQTDFVKYGLTKTSTSSGISLNVLYDDRENSINPDKGNYLKVVYGPNFTFMGSDADWQSLQVDFRKYIRLPGHSENVLALWSYDWFTLAGDPPYLLLPNTGGDPYGNTGRGYIQGRFRSKNSIYAEAEYRFNLLKNGLLGAVVFANAQSVTEQASGRFEIIHPGYGGGLRIKLNKFSKTNIAIDYGLAPDGSGGFFVNLAEVF